MNTQQNVSAQEIKKVKELYNKSKHAVALKAVEGLLKRDPGCSMLYLLRGRILMDSGKGAKAGRDFTKAIKLEPNYSEAYLSRAVLKRNRRDMKGSKKDFDKYDQLEKKQGQRK